MNSKKAKQLRKESKKFASYTGLPWDKVYEQLKKTGKGINLKQTKNGK